MKEILFLAHRIPYPPDRGDRMRSWHLLRHLGRYAKVHLAAFTELDSDDGHVAAMREAMGEGLGEVHLERRVHDNLKWALRALWRREPIVNAAFYSRAMRDFAQRIAAERPIEAVVAFSFQMAQYVPSGPRFIMDFCDVDSAKFADYAKEDRWLHWAVHKHEAIRVRALERDIARRADLSLFVTEAETALFRAQAGAIDADVRPLSNGIDLAYYDPKAGFARLDPPPAGPLLVFTGQMSYRPNVEGVTAFADKVMPLVRRALPEAGFAIVGRDPAAEVQALADRPGIVVTGEVPDVRPWLAAAAVVVAPLAIARGVQNKVLEAMAMARPVVASPGAFCGIDAEPGRDLIVAGDDGEQAEAILALIADPKRAAAMGKAGRRRMVEAYSWDARLAPLAEMAGLAA
ncbi:MAG TPA: TIGR03087 family PEP-CTERM/XrtA system glycosyltransferase [Allosphingosinicella sp.]|nr:TIGR03087 family PEP-CTERM/XrtA system glycosyltransferase [Allosphingosinicella sp.]